MTLTLYVDGTYASPYALSAYVTLAEKGLPFTLETIDLAAAENLGQEYRDRSLTARVPTLIHGDFALPESTAIMEYLEEVFPAPEHPSVLPAGVQARARARQIQAWLRSDLLALRDDWTTETIFLGKAGGPLSTAGEQAARKLLRVTGALIQDDQPHLFDQWCIADTDLALMLQRLLVNGYPVPGAIAAYAAHQWQRPSVQRWMALDR
jgi:glutathione S-transferase